MIPSGSMSRKLKRDFFPSSVQTLGTESKSKNILRWRFDIRGPTNNKEDIHI